MIERVVAWLGLEREVPEGARLSFEWGHLPRGESGLVLVLAAAGLVALTVWLYRREGRASAWRKGLLAGLRLAVFALVLGVFLEPRLAVDLERTVEGRTIVLWDTSQSMSLQDRYQEPGRRQALADAAGLADPTFLEALDRSELAWRLVDRARLLPGLAERNRVVFYTFDAEPRALDGPPGEGALAPRGPATDLALAVRRALEDASGTAVAAVVLVSDGRVTKGEGAQGAARALEKARVPLFALGVGDPVPPRNLEVVETSAEPRVMLGDPLVIEVTARGQGYAGEQVEAVLTVERTDAAQASEPVELERRPVVVPGDGETVGLTFRHAPEAAGSYLYRIQLPKLEEEPDHHDNQGEVTVTVTEDTTRVLLVAGGPSFEYHHLKARLIRERAAVVSCWLQSADARFPQEGNEGARIEAMPVSATDLERYDLVILLDPDPEAFDAAAAEAYKSFVADAKGGLLFIAGPKHTEEFLRRADLRPFRDLLPVIPGEGLETHGAATEPWPLRVTEEGADHPATRLDPDPARCKALWTRLPALFFGFPVEREKAGATVLARHEDPGAMTEHGGRPLVVSHFFDGGPVVFLGSDETWRWRATAGKVYDRYWVGLLRFLVQGRLAGGRRRVELLTDKEEYVLGEPVRVRAHAYDRAYRPLEVEELAGEVRLEAEVAPLALARSPGRQPGWYEAVVLPPGAGSLELSVRLPDADPGEEPESLTITVKRPDLEFRSPQLDEEALQGIAATTSGALVAPGELGGLPARIPGRTERHVVAGTPIPLWDRWEAVALICLLFSIEWWIRKRSRMV